MGWRAVAVWLLIIAVESVHGTIRQLFVAPAIGDLPARQLGVATGSLLILAVAWLTARWLGATTVRAQLEVGALWVVLTILFEAGLGRVLGLSWARLLADYDPGQGGLMGLGLVVLLLSPAVGARLCGRSGGRASR
jgi:hypothetical protein